MPFEVQRFCTTTQDGVVRVRWYRPWSNLQAFFHALKPRRHLFFGGTFELELVCPVFECLLGGVEAGCPVNDGCATDATALQDRHRAVFAHTAGAFLIEVVIGFTLIHLKIISAFQRAFFQHQYIEAGFRKNFCGGTAACTGTNNDDISSNDAAISNIGCILNVPAARDTLQNRIRDTRNHWNVWCTFHRVLSIGFCRVIRQWQGMGKALSLVVPGSR